MLFLIKILLFPIAFIYGCLVEIVKISYRWGLQRSHRFSDIFVLKIGNLSVGGTGKTPHAMYVVSFLQTFFSVAVISRGYGRQTKKVLVVNAQLSAKEVGDEPALMARILPNSVPIIVANQRVAGIQLAQQQFPNIRVCVLDDAMQHWSLISNKNILLTTYQEPFFEDFPLPSGRLREFAYNYKRADVLIVTKCSPFISENEQDSFRKRFRLGLHQQLFFSWYEYAPPYEFLNVQNTLTWDFLRTCRVLVVVGIAQTQYLEDFLSQNTLQYELLAYSDHHEYSLADLNHIQQKFQQSAAQPTYILTTEKDALRLELQKSFILQQKLPIFCLPIRVAMHTKQEQELQTILLDWVRANT